MGHPVNRRKINRPSSPTFDYTNRKLSGLPERDPPDVRAEKERLVQEFLEKKKRAQEKR